MEYFYIIICSKHSVFIRLKQSQIFSVNFVNYFVSCILSLGIAFNGICQCNWSTMLIGKDICDLFESGVIACRNFQGIIGKGFVN